MIEYYMQDVHHTPDIQITHNSAVLSLQNTASGTVRIFYLWIAHCRVGDIAAAE